MIRFEILSGKQAGQVILARRFPFRIGRSPQADLALSDPGVWDDHCWIDHRPGQGFVLGSGSAAETRVDAAPVETERRLPNGAEIAVGAARLRFSLADTRARGLLLREGVTWLFIIAVIAGEVWLASWLPR